MKKFFLVCTLLVFLSACATPTPLAPPPSPVPPTPTETAPDAGQAPVTSPQLTQFHFVNENDGWATTQAMILRTHDGGRTWVNATPQVNAQFGYISAVFLDAQTAWALLPVNYFDSGTLYQTSDGGLTWKSIAVPFAAASLQVLDAHTAIAMAGLGAGAGSQAVAFYKSTDAGQTWTRLFVNDPTVTGSSNSLPLGGDKGGFAFNNAQSGWVGGSIPVDNEIYLYHTQDGGATWNQFPLALPPGYETAQTGNAGPIFFSASEGILPVNFVMPSEPDGLSVFYHTTDGGQTWTPGQVIHGGRPYDFRSFRDGVAWSGSQFYFTSDSGQTWGAVQSNVDFSNTIVSFQFVNALVGWVLADQSNSQPTLYQTTDGGATWTALIP